MNSPHHKRLLPNGTPGESEQEGKPNAQRDGQQKASTHTTGRSTPNPDVVLELFLSVLSLDARSTQQRCVLVCNAFDTLNAVDLNSSIVSNARCVPRWWCKSFLFFSPSVLSFFSLSFEQESTNMDKSGLATTSTVSLTMAVTLQNGIMHCAKRACSPEARSPPVSQEKDWGHQFRFATFFLCHFLNSAEHVVYQTKLPFKGHPFAINKNNYILFRYLT